MAKDLLLGETPRDWSRGADLLADPVSAPVPATPSIASEALRQAMGLNSTLKIRPAGRGVTVTKIWKWG